MFCLSAFLCQFCFSIHNESAPSASGTLAPTSHWFFLPSGNCDSYFALLAPASKSCLYFSLSRSFCHSLHVCYSTKPPLLLLLSSVLPTPRKMPLLFTTPRREVFELTPEELNARSVHSTRISHMEDEISPKISVPELEQPMLPKHAGPSPFDGNAEAATTPPLQISTTRSPHSLSCPSSSSLIEILTPDELLRKNNPGPPQTPTSPSKSGRRDGIKPRSFVKVAMTYNKYGELVEESKLRHHPTPDELSVTQLLRVIRKKFHHDVSAHINTGPTEMRATPSYILLCLRNTG